MKLNILNKVLLVVVVISTLCVLAIVLGLIWSMPDVPKKVITDEICLPDSSGELRCGKTVNRLFEYTQSRIDSEIETLDKEYDEYIKGVNSESQVELKQFVEKQYFDRKPAARLVMSDDYNRKKREAETKQSSSNITMVPITKWESVRNLRDYGGFLRFGMLNNDGRIMVPVTGTYAVSSYVDMSPKLGSNGRSLKHALYKYNLKENSEMEIVSNLHPKQNTTMKNANEQGSFLTTLAKLTSGEEVLVKVSDNAEFPKHEQNYLAVYLI